MQMGSIPDPGRSYTLLSSEAHAPQLLSLCSRALKLQLLSPHTLKPVLLNKRNHHNEKPEHCNQRVAPTHHNWRKAFTAVKTQHSSVQHSQKLINSLKLLRGKKPMQSFKEKFQRAQNQKIERKEKER